jgi:hypothetical protein
MTLSLRRSVTAATALIAATWLISSACSSAGTTEAGALGTSGVDPTLIAVDTSNQFVVAVTNNAGQPLEDVRISIQPVGSAPPFTATIRRMENTERRELSPTEFRSNDGTTFTPRVYKARQVTVTATDLVGKKHEVTKPWGR